MSSHQTSIIELNDPELGPIYIEVPGELSRHKGWEAISNTSEGGVMARIEGRLDEVLSSLQRFAKGTIKVLQSLKPDEVEIKTGVKFMFREGKILGLLAQAEGEFPFEITIKWNLNSTPKVL